MKNNKEPKLDLLGTDLFLIVETHEELINRLIGTYARMRFIEKKKNGYDFENENTIHFSNKIRALNDLKIELAKHLYDINFQKEVIKSLEIQLKEAKALEDSFC